MAAPILKVKPSSLDSHQVSPYWLALVVPFKNQDTFNRDSTSPGSLDVNEMEEQDLILIDNDCISWQTSSSKESHVSTLNMSLLPTRYEYSSVLAPEDWILFWAFNNYADYIKIKSNIKNKDR